MHLPAHTNQVEEKDMIATKQQSYFLEIVSVMLG